MATSTADRELDATLMRHDWLQILRARDTELARCHRAIARLEREVIELRDRLEGVTEARHSSQISGDRS